ncbi:MAG: hypothetical protein HY578_09080 [Nitrospinae bacterium]|nr:hypothetical protein [Nitrospinota bacterium]
MKVIYIIAGVIGILFLIDAFNRAKVRQAKQTGLYPPAGHGTDEDVERLAAKGEKIMAIKLYREIHGVDLKTAKEAVDKIVKDSPLKRLYNS